MKEEVWNDKARLTPIVVSAAKGGKLDILLFLKDKGCSFSVSVIGTIILAFLFLYSSLLIFNCVYFI